MGAVALLIFIFVPAAGLAQVGNFTNVTTEDLENPDPADWFAFSRTPDAQRYSPLGQIDRGNVGGLRMAWSRGTGNGTQESIPIVRDGIMYLIQPGSNILALDATTGDLIWEYEREYANPNQGNTRSKTIAIYEDVVITTTPDSYVVGLDARTGESAVGNASRRPRTQLRADHGRWKGGDWRHLSGRPCQLLYRGPRRAHRRTPLEVLHDAGPRRPAGIRHLGRRSPQ